MGSRCGQEGAGCGGVSVDRALDRTLLGTRCVPLRLECKTACHIFMLIVPFEQNSLRSAQEPSHAF